VTTIEELLHRRTDLSTFLVHLTRDSDGSEGTARDNLLSIAKTGVMEARTAFGPAASYERQLADVATQKAVCFTETPLEHTWMMLQDIDGRRLKFQPYGIAITKTTARKDGFNPVWYSDITPGRTWPITAVNTMVKEAIADATGHSGSVDVEALKADPRFPLFRLTPFFEQMGPTNTSRKEFWWEREWRRSGDHRVRPRRIVAVLAPADDHDALRGDLAKIDEKWAERPLLDPRWGLERMIAAMSGIDDEDLGPFPDAA
jgi:hypothetical protein